MKNPVVCLLGFAVILAASALAADDAIKVEDNDTTESVTASNARADISDQLVVYYLHSTRRCMTCKKLEAYSQEAISTGFAKQLTDSTIVWRVVNFEEEGNEHYVKDYQLYTKSLILSMLCDGKETGWKNLDKIWELVGDKDEFIEYIQTEVRNFMKPAEEE